MTTFHGHPVPPPAMFGTPFHDRTSPLNQHHLWFNWDGYAVPDVYEDVSTELSSIRRHVAMCDMSPLSKYEFRGPDAEAFLDHLTTRDMTIHRVGRVRYTPMCDESGKVVSETLVFRLASDVFRISTDPIEGWLTTNAQGFEVDIEDITASYGILSLQGPESKTVMDKLIGDGWTDVAFSEIGAATIAGVELLVARQGFTGELGYELWVPRSGGPTVWDAVTAAGEAVGIRPAGEHAIEIARIEAGMLIMGADYAKAGPDRLGTQTRTIPGDLSSPFELGLGRFVDLQKPGFIGRKPLLDEAGLDGPPRRLCGLVLDDRDLARCAEVAGVSTVVPARVSYYPRAAHDGKRRIGRATSVTWSPTLRHVIAFGHLDRDFSVVGREVEVEWTVADEPRRVAARVVDLPFVPLRRALDPTAHP